MTERFYKVAGLVFSVRLEEPWSFMNYTAAVAERIRVAAIGGLVPVMPTRAGDGEPPRTYVRSREELPDNYGGNVLDFSQYEPFATEECSDTLFGVTVCAGGPDEVANAHKNGEMEKIMSMTDVLPYYHVYRWRGGTVFEFEGEGGKIDGTLYVAQGAEKGQFWAGTHLRPYSVMFQLCFALRIMYTYNAVRKNAALLHASVILCNDVAVLFFGSSGTGKSTHSRLWLENIPGAELLNDDNPVIRIEDGKFNVYGTPWSGKTPCYRNVTAPVCAFVRLSQAPENKVRKLSGLDSFTNIISSASSIRWERGVMDGIMSVMSYSAMHVKCLYMECLPNKEAAEICYGETVKSM